MQGQKKQGLQQPQIQFVCQQNGVFLRGIPKSLVIKSKIQASHLTCIICNQIVWKAVACGQPNCFANFCQYCIGNNQTTSDTIIGNKKCISCQKPFLRTSIPLINNLLSQMVFKCAFYNLGCQQTVSYDIYLKHIQQCGFKKTSCVGCNNYFLKKDLQNHLKQCPQLIIQCINCGQQLKQEDFTNNHTAIACFQGQLSSKRLQVKQIQQSVIQLNKKISTYQICLQKIMRGQHIPLNVDFYSSFPYNFQFSLGQARLSKSSWNQSKQKFDFLHFYLPFPIKTDCPLGYQWKVIVKILKGNLLIGICSSLSTNSVDFVINRFGQIKKKQANENKYKLIRKSPLTFSEGDSLYFNYYPLRKILKIQNFTKKIQSRLQAKQISQLGEHIYSFYSLDTINDTVKFI